MAGMTRDELRNAIDVLWDGNQRRAATELNLGYRTIRAYLADPDASSARAIPDGVATDVRMMLERFPTGMLQVDPHQTLRVLQEHMVRFGWTEAEAAAGILESAIALARQQIGDDAVRDLLAEA